MKRSVATSSKGKEGMGAEAQYQIFCRAWAHMNNKEYTFTPFKNIEHYQHTGVTQEEFCNDVNKLFQFDKAPLPSKSSEWLNTPSLKGYWQNHLDSLYPFLKDQVLFLDEDKKYFNAEEINVAIHVRVRTHLDPCSDPAREYFDVSRKLDPKVYYANIISGIKRCYLNKKVSFYIYSQGSPEDFKFFNEMDDNVHLHIEEYPPISVYHMANADVLVMANSSFSYVAHLYGKCFTIARDSFYHRLYEKTSVRADVNGIFDEKKLLNYEK